MTEESIRDQEQEHRDYVASLESDRKRLDWVMPILSCTDDDSSVTDARAMRIAAALMLGKTGRAAIDVAMQ